MHIEKYDIIICGGGLAGLSLLYRAMKSGIWEDQQIVVVDQSDKTENDRTWSFWKKEDTDFDQLIYKEWKDLVFFTNDGQRVPLRSGAYSYNSIRSIDFYTHVLAYLRTFDTINFVKSAVEVVFSDPEGCTLVTKTHTYHATYLFNSLYRKPELRPGDQYFLQHFKGLRIKTHASIPPVTEAWLMDFRTGQEQGTTFFYTLPIARDEIFIEYTLFSKSLLLPAEYDQGIAKYVSEVLGIKDYEVLEEEFGVIPMTSYAFNRFEGNIIHIGSAGGDTRASTGYTFINTQKTISKILDSYQAARHPFFKAETIGLKQHLYDATLLNVLAEGKYQGHQLFSDLFKNTPAAVIFSFLDAEGSLLQDLKVMKSLRIWPFLKAISKALWYKR